MNWTKTVGPLSRAMWVRDDGARILRWCTRGFLVLESGSYKVASRHETLEEAQENV